jgi:hypothetical protein
VRDFQSPDFLLLDDLLSEEERLVRGRCPKRAACPGPRA